MTAEHNIISFKKSAKENLFQPVDALPLGIFRFLFGFLLCIEFLVLSRETFPHYYIEPVFHFTYPLFDLLGLKPLSKPSLWLIFNALQISTVGIMLGLLTRICFIVFTSAFGYFFFMESAPYTNHYYLIFLLSFLMCFGHSGSICSIDSLINKNARKEQVGLLGVIVVTVSKFVLCFFCWPGKIECRLANPCRAPLFKSSQTFFFSGLSSSRKMDGYCP